MDKGVFPGHYHDYADNDVALQRELEIGESLGQSPIWIDDVFPPNARSLYYDPLNPPKGGIPNESIKWFSICEGGLTPAEPEFYFKDVSSPHIVPGSLGNKYFTNALSLIACQPKIIDRLLVSKKYASRGIYTFKFYKCGRWRYVHIDDHIPCRQSGNVHFAHNLNPNETFAMLIEKAYAKLHGCYEALTYGFVEQVLQDMGPGPGVKGMRLERIPLNNICDVVWDALEDATQNNALVGCVRSSPDPENENPALSQGISLGQMYQIVDMVVTTAEPTQDFDALTVGMVCVRNLQSRVGRFTGRWSFGHKLWGDYKEIASDLRQRTREIQFQRGLGPDPSKPDVDEDELDLRKRAETYYDKYRNPDDESDNIDTTYQEQKSQAFKIVQPIADDLHWIQIEDFVEVFNRVFIMDDFTLEKKALCKRFVSKWLPGDFIVGSGGPPVVIQEEMVEQEPEEKKGNGGEDEDEPAEEKLPAEPQFRKYVTINENFTDNPMFPITVNEPSRIAIALFQLDKRWNSGRMGDDPREVAATTFISRKERLQTVCQYQVGIGFLLCRLNGPKIRLTDFKLRKVAYTSGDVAFSSCCNAYFNVFPGRYAIIPYTHAALDRVMEYALHLQYYPGHIDMEIEDPIAQRLQDKEPSDDGGIDEDLPDDNDLLRLNPQTEEVTVLNYEKVPPPVLEDEDELSVDYDEPRDMPPMVQLPKIYVPQRWEYEENVEEIAMANMFGEVRDMMIYLRSLRKEMHNLNAAVNALSAIQINPYADSNNAAAAPASPTNKQQPTK